MLQAPSQCCKIDDVERKYAALLCFVHRAFVLCLDAFIYCLEAEILITLKHKEDPT